MNAISPHRRRPLRLGFVPLVDAAPIAFAEETGIFARRGLHVELKREPGWATIRDSMAYGELEAAHAPAGLAFALSWGLGVLRQPCIAGYLLNSNGGAITVSRELHESGVTDAASFAAAAKRPRRALTLGVPHLFSTHHFLLRHWLRPEGVVAGRDLRLAVLPPQLMARCLAAGDIDGYCVGEPYNALAEREGTGRIVAESADIVPLHPEKALVVNESFHDRESETHRELIRAIAEAAAQCETREGREAVAEILSQPRYLGTDPALIRSSLFAGGDAEPGKGKRVAGERFHVFSHPEVNRPDAEKANWLVGQMRLAGLLDRVDVRRGPLPNQIFREDVFDAAFASPRPAAKRRQSPSMRTPEPAIK